MKRTLMRTSLILSALIVMLLTASPALAQGGGFEEDFSDTALTDWERSEGAVVKDGALVISPGNFAFKIGDYREYSLSVDARFSGGGVVFIRFNMREEQDNAVLFFGDRVILEKTVSGEPNELASAEWNGFSGDWQTLQLVNTSTNISVLVDGETLISKEMEGLEGGGGFGFVVEGESLAEFDNLKVTPAAQSGPAEVGAEQVIAPTPTATSAPSALSALINSLTGTQSVSLDITTIVINLFLAVVLAYILSRVYVHWGSSLSNRRRFAANFILITVTTTFIILIVRSSVALSLGLVGALSIVRFRAAIKEPEELAYLFFAIGIGIGLGDNQRLITVIALAVGIIVIAIMRLFRGRSADFNLHLTVTSSNPGKVALEDIRKTIQANAAQARMMRFDENKDTMEASYLVEFRNNSQFETAKNALQALSKEIEITFIDNKGIG